MIVAVESRGLTGAFHISGHDLLGTSAPRLSTKMQRSVGVSLFRGGAK